MNFNDSRKWGRYTFLDMLETNKVAFSFDGTNLDFPNEDARQRAVAIWYNLSGSKQLGSYSKE